MPAGHEWEDCLFLIMIAMWKSCNILWLGEVQRSSPFFVILSCPLVGLVLVPQVGFCFVGLPFFPSASWPLSFLSLFLRPCLIHAWMPDWGRAFVHGHTFLHSWSGPMTLVVGLLLGATFLSNLTLVLFVSLIRLSSWKRRLLNPLIIIICESLIHLILSIRGKILYHHYIIFQYSLW